MSSENAGGGLVPVAIKPVGVGEDEALGMFLEERSFGGFKPNPASALLRSEADVVRAVEQDSAAIGYASGTAANASHGVRVIAVDGVAPTALTIANSTYPLSRRVSLYINRKPGTAIEPAVAGFLLFCLSDPAQTELRANEGYFSLPTATRQRMEQKSQARGWQGRVEAMRVAACLGILCSAGLKRQSPKLTPYVASRQVSGTIPRVGPWRRREGLHRVPHARVGGRLR